MEKRELICIGCPMGCPMTVELDNGEVVSVKGNTGKRGDIYARKEVTNPTRIVTSTVRVTGGIRPVVSVKTANDIPKAKIFEVMDDINGIVAKAPVTIGEVLLKNVAGTGVDVIATGNLRAV